MKVFARTEGYGALAGALAVSLVAGVGAGAVGTHPLVAVPLALAAGALTYALLMRRWLRRWRVLQTPLAPELREALERDVAFYRRLDAPRRLEFERNVQCFLAEHAVTGPRGAPVDDATRALVAAAAMLVFGREDLDFPPRFDIVVYPGAFDEEHQVRRDGMILGQARAQGPMILSGPALKEGFRRASDGENVGLHELAHLLDLEAGGFDGLPTGMPWAASGAWLALVHKEMTRVRRHQSVLRGYAAQDEMEFFAVAVEGFFERSVAMREKHPALYRALAEFFGQDPAAGAGVKLETREAQATAGSTP